MPTELEERLLNQRRANVREQTRMTAAYKLTRDAPGLFIEETLFSCLASFCRHCKGNFEQIEALFKPVVRQSDKGELARLVALCTGETSHADFTQTDSGGRTGIAPASPEARLSRPQPHRRLRDFSHLRRRYAHCKLNTTQKKGETQMTLDGAIPSMGLNPKWTFEEFVIGPSNGFAHAAALTVAQSPGAAYNPLYICGGQGLGKTHLMQAIGHRVQQMTNKSVVYITAETFLNDYIDAIQMRALVEYRNKYRSVDLLLVDDVNFFADKACLQKEFYHTFNALYASSKQIIMTCDSPPSGVAGLEQNLVSRFEWGLVTEIDPPDVELRMAILRSKQKHAKMQLGDELLTFLAVNVTSNIRSLEGALLRAISFASFNGQPLTIESMRHLLRDLITEDS